MKSFKIKIPNPYISELVQKKAFELGYSWIGDQEIQYTEAKALSFRERRILHWLGSTEGFDEAVGEEITWHDFLLLESAEEEGMTVEDLVRKYRSKDESYIPLTEWLIEKYGNYKLLKP